ncbi:hypothetical protein [Pararhizobium sp.]|uniref:hypothetical protein n=1 Tax=Pararhizobium sp. TaxID=1977563 RepID=UPI00271865AD|nr:hypothetical protein [Pararhizobium sp.]MDO9416049.1 hypothetical protein [Pararhizobium sp.]
MIRTIAAALLISLASTGMASAADYVEDYGAPSACENPSVLGFITRRFDYKAKHYLYADLAITDISHVGQSRYEPLSETRRTSREYCHAKVSMSDGERRSVWYLIERNWGFAGIGPSVEFCISGLDPWYVYGAQCKSLR